MKPYTAFGIDYRAAMLPFAIPILAAAEIGNYIVFDEKGYTKENDRSQNANSLLAMLSGLLSLPTNFLLTKPVKCSVICFYRVIEKID